jgi:hypothetical protein
LGKSEIITKRMKTDKAWHEKNRMPKNATFEKRVKWHLEHQKNCECRPIPDKLKQQMKERGIKFIA